MFFCEFAFTLGVHKNGRDGAALHKNVLATCSTVLYRGTVGYIDNS